jgi:hypothetical protein
LFNLIDKNNAKNCLENGCFSAIGLPSMVFGRIYEQSILSIDFFDRDVLKY